jgi:flagellar motor switch protein FliM
MSDPDAPAGSEAADPILEWSGQADQEAEVGEALLQPEEIDSLFAAIGGGGGRSGIETLVASAAVNYERLPMLEVVFDRLVRIMTTSLRNFTSENVEVSLESITSLRFGDYLDSVPLPAMIAVFRAVEWDDHGLLTLSSPLIYSIVDVLMGGRRGVAPMRTDGRAFTKIERGLAERLIRLVLADMAAAFAPLSTVEFRFERIESNPRFAAIARSTNAAVLVKLRIEMDERGGPLEILIPYATLEPVRDLLLQMFMGEKFGRDQIWESHLARQMLVTDVELEALLEEQTIALGEVMRFEVGTLLPLSGTAGSPVVLRCGQVPLLSGRAGRVADQLAIRIDAKVERDWEAR